MMALLVLAGIVVGYVTVSVCESFFHRTIQHASPCFRELCKRRVWIGAPFFTAWVSHHLIHHCLTYRSDHVTQFGSPGEERALRDLLSRKGYGRLAGKRAYGARIGGPREVLVYMLPTLPIYSCVCYLGGLWFTAGALLPLIVWPLFAQFVHPYLHMTRAEAMRRATPAMRLLLRTPYFDTLYQHHWLHHRHPECNFNLVMGGDLLLGRHRSATDQEIEQITKLRETEDPETAHVSILEQLPSMNR